MYDTYQKLVIPRFVWWYLHVSICVHINDWRNVKQYTYTFLMQKCSLNVCYHKLQSQVYYLVDELYYLVDATAATSINVKKWSPGEFVVLFFIAAVTNMYFSFFAREDRCMHSPTAIKIKLLTSQKLVFPVSIHV